MSIDSEYQIFRLLPLELSSKIERTVYNRRRRKLFGAIEQMRERLSNMFNEFEDCFIVDSMPLEERLFTYCRQMLISSEVQFNLFENYKIKLNTPIETLSS